MKPRVFLFILATLLAALAQTAAAQTPEPPAIPLGFHLARGDAEHIQAARAAGGEFVVVVFSWADIEPEPGYHYWAAPDAALTAAEFYGLEVIARLDQPPPWAVRSGENPPFDAYAYAAFAGTVARRYGNRLAGLILWNEPNLSLEWNNQPPDAAGYVTLLKQAYTTIKLVAPDLPVGLAAPASTEGEGDWAVNDLDYLQALYNAGAKDYFDVLTAHPYGFGRPPTDAPQKYRPNFRRLELYRRLMAANNDAAKPVWVTELGWLTATDNPNSAWQVVSAQTQADYILGAIDYARQNYPWLARLGLWQLSREGDDYGFNLWNGPDAPSPAYTALANAFGPPPNSKLSPQNSTLQILAPDTIIRLGDRDRLHPHWVHVHNGRSLSWTGEFFLTEAQAGQSFELLLETMQITQPGNRILLNGQQIGLLAQRARLDITSTWVTQKFTVPPHVLRPGRNTFTVTLGPRNPLRQYVTARWENMQLRHVRLRPATKPPEPLFSGWQPRPAPGGWSETARLIDTGGHLWLAGNRPGQLWQLAAAAPFTLTNRSANRPDLVFTDVLDSAAGQLAATDRGLVWQQADDSGWQPAAAPAAHAYTVAQFGREFVAGFEGDGLWAAPDIAGPWQRTPLTATTVIDLQPGPDGRLWAVAPNAIFAAESPAGPWRSLPLPGLPAQELAESNEYPGDKMRPRLYFNAAGQPVLRVQDRLWVGEESGVRSQESGESQTAVIQNWRLFGPEELAGKIISVINCCNAGTIIGTSKAGLWQLAAGGAWQRLDDGAFDVTDATTLHLSGEALLAGGEAGLLVSRDGGAGWQIVPGLPVTVSDLLVDPAEPSRWVAGTPAGVYLSRDAGDSWQPVSPPWTVWDMAFGPAGRLFVGRSTGLGWVDDLAAEPPVWHDADGMNRVFFLHVNPHPVEPALVWSGTWGNNIGASSDGGQNVQPVHNGLETLSGLDIIWHPTPGQVTLATIEGLFRTDDGGASWFKLPGPLQQQTVFNLLQTDDGAIWAGAADGLWLSRDYGATWAQADAVPPATVLRLGALAGERGEWLWAGTEGAGLWLSRDGGATWQFGGLPERTVFNIFFNPTRPGQLVAATDAGIFATPLEE